ncbi:MAG: DinB family protein [Gemmatimonadaceae bacterium]|nr:DinB family protein [Gemmatimonadaceae bacterium]
MHPRLAELIEYADSTRDALLAQVAAFPAERAHEAGANGGWSLSQQLAHLHLVEQSSVRAMFRALKDARKAGLGAETETSSLRGILDATGLASGTRRLEAPDFVTPTDTPGIETALARLRESREGLHAWAREGDGYALATVTFPHPRLGVLNLYEWVEMISGHERRHMLQIERLRAGGA